MTSSRDKTFIEILQKERNYVDHKCQTQGLWAESGPPPCFILPGTLFLPGRSAKLLDPS